MNTTPGDIRRVKEIFDGARRLGAADRPAFLDAACGADAALRARVVELLHDLAAAGPLLAEPTLLGAAGPEQPLARGESAGEGRTQLGPYTLEERIGEGGFGEVWTARQHEPFPRRVAVKILKPGMDSREVLARFEVERQALALMDHPHVARVFDAGRTEPQSPLGSGRPYFVMEHAAGLPITDYCDANRLRIRARLELFVAVCQAVQHAHAKGIIHRDLKPSNILVTLADGRPVPKVIDFGIAKATAAPLLDRPRFTELGRLMGTPEYMSPEQASTSGVDVDTRSDIYSLGVILYQLLTGTLPFSPQVLRTADYSSMVQLLREQEPPTPSSRLATLGTEPVNQPNGVTPREIAVRRDLDFQALRRQVRGELDWIVMKCLEKDRARRYETANGLATDVQRYLTGEPVAAAPPSTAYRIRKFVRRNRGPVTFAALVMTTMALGLASTLWQASRAADRARAAGRAESEQRRLAESEAKARGRAEAINNFVLKALRSSDPQHGGRQDMLVADAMTSALREIDAGAFKDDPETDAELRDTIGMILLSNGRAAEAEPILAQALEMRRRHLNGDHAAIAQSLGNLAMVRSELGRVPEAEPLFVESLEMYQRLDHPAALLALNNLGGLRQSQGRLAEAEALFEQVLDRRRRLHEGDHADVAFSLNNLAVAREALGRPAEAEPLYVQALEMRQRLYPGDHPELAGSLNNVAYVRQALGRTAEAEPLYVQALEMRQRLYKGDHPDLASSLNNLAFARSSLNRPAEAEPLYVAALEMNQRLFKGDHPQIAANLNGLAFVRQSLGRTAEAEPLYVQSLEMKQRLFQGDHPDVALSLNNVASVRMSLGRAAEAESCYVQALEMRQRLFKGDHPDVAQGFHNLAHVRMTLGRAEEAESDFVQALEMIQRVYKGDHTNVVRCMLSLAECRLALGRGAEALALHREALAMQRRLLPPESLALASSLGLAGMAFVKVGTPQAAAEAEPILRECLSIRVKLLPDDHRHAWMKYFAMSVLGEALVVSVENELAEPRNREDALARLCEAEELLLKAGARFSVDPAVPAPTPQRDYRREVFGRAARLYDAWHAVVPDGDYDARAGEWRAKLDALRRPQPLQEANR